MPQSAAFVRGSSRAKNAGKKVKGKKSDKFCNAHSSRRIVDHNVLVTLDRVLGMSGFKPLAKLRCPANK
jgi:hypothetical protein